MIEQAMMDGMEEIMYPLSMEKYGKINQMLLKIPLFLMNDTVTGFNAGEFNHLSMDVLVYNGNACLSGS